MTFSAAITSLLEEAAVREEIGVEAVTMPANHGHRRTPPPIHAAQYLRAHVLELPIHQDDGPSQAAYISGQVLRLEL